MKNRPLPAHQHRQYNNARERERASYRTRDYRMSARPRSPIHYVIPKVTILNACNSLCLPPHQASSFLSELIPLKTIPEWLHVASEERISNESYGE